MSEVFHGSDLKVSGFQTEQILGVTKYQYFSSRNCQNVDQIRKLNVYQVIFLGLSSVYLHKLLLPPVKTNILIEIGEKDLPPIDRDTY